jgi:hypothetical protein
MTLDSLASIGSMLILSVNYQDQGDIEKAIEMLKTISEIGPAHTPAHPQSGPAPLASTGQHDQADQ